MKGHSMATIKWDLEAEHELWRSICAPKSWFDENGRVATHPASLYWFVRLAWGVDFFLDNHPEQPRWFADHIHKPYLEWLQTHLLRWQDYCLAGGTDRYYIASVIPRQFGKTICSTKSSMLWLHLREPDMSTLIASATTSLSADIYNAIREVMSGEEKDSWFAWLYGNWRQGAKEWTKEHCSHAYRRSRNMSEPSFDVTSVDTGMTGYHHRIHVWDDPIYANKLREGKDAYMRSVHTAVNASYNAFHTNGLLMFTLTRYADGDVAGKHFRDEGIASWSGMPCPHMHIFDKIAFGKGIWNVYFLQTEDELTGEPIHPTIFDKKKIAEHKARDPEDFACQQQNNPGTGENAPLLESQLPQFFMDYKDFLYEVMPVVECVSIHIDTAFKKLETLRTGDDNAIVPWLHDARRNGMIYLDTDFLRASNAWREEDFNDELVKILLAYRRRAIRISKMTDEVEPGGKAGAYKNRIMSVIMSTGINFGPDQFVQLNRTTNKKARIRTSVGYWVENYVRILLHKDAKGQWIIPPVVRKLFNQIIRVDVSEHDDVADAAADVFAPGIWKRPLPRTPDEEGTSPRGPYEEDLKALSRPLTNEEVFQLVEENKQVQEWDGPGRGWSPDDYDNDPREPIR